MTVGGRVEFGILGPVEASVDGARLILGGPTPRALTAMLVLHLNQPVRMDALVEGLWGERPPPSAQEGVSATPGRADPPRRVLAARPDH